MATKNVVVIRGKRYTRAMVKKMSAEERKALVREQIKEHNEAANRERIERRERHNMRSPWWRRFRITPKRPRIGR